jgi:hydrogenase-4 component B
MVSETLTLNLFLAALACFGAGAVGAVATATSPRASRLIAHLLALVGAGCAFALGIAGLLGGTLRVALPQILPLGGLDLGIDRLSAFFVLVIAVSAIPASLYAIGYTHKYEGEASLAAMGIAFNLFLAAMVLVALARNALTFLVVWEAMSLMAYFLVMTEGERDDVQTAGWVYLAMAHVGLAALFIGFLLMTGATGTMQFDAWGAAAQALPPLTRDVIFVLLALGFGSKAGVVPLHVWLPRAHPAAPSHASALMSGVMIKLGVYGLVRIGFDWLGGGPAWWGGALLIVAALTAIFGALYALIEHDLKRLLAYSSIENIGIILIGVGASMLFTAFHQPILAGIALIAALLHTLNHTFFKSLLFLGAGAVDYAAGTRELDALGGLVRRMPWTALFFLAGALSIAAVPPFNGYVSEWMTLESLLQSFALADTTAKIVMAIAGALLALTAGVAVTASGRAFGIVFLAQPRSDAARHAREVPRTMLVALGVLAALCLAVGVLPTLVLPALDAVAAPLVGASVINHLVPPLFTNNPGDYALLVGLGGGILRGVIPANGLVIIASPSLTNATAPTYLFIVEAILIALTLAALRIFKPRTARRIAPVWAGGIPRFTPPMQYTALAYSNPVRMIFNGVFRSTTRLEMTAPAAEHREGKIAYAQDVPPPFERWLYRPLLRALDAAAWRVKVIQSGNVNQYIAYIFAIVLVILILRAV